MFINRIGMREEKRYNITETNKVKKKISGENRHFITVGTVKNAKHKLLTLISDELEVSFDRPFNITKCSSLLPCNTPK